ncbi:MAG TPA: DNA translocase FtsK 4TM domain-containing protein, partial [bacterium]|nr:DNA translocase FtsK 4TM domain-containing protein [bacterium]
MPRLKKAKRTGKTQSPLAKAILAAAVSLIVLVSLFSGRMGVVGGFFQRVLGVLFGAAAPLLPLFSLGVALAVISGHKVKMEGLSGLILVFLMIAIGLQLSNFAMSPYPQGRGGFVGKILALGLVQLFGRIGSWILLTAFTIIGLVLTNEGCFHGLISSVGKWLNRRPSLRRRSPESVLIAAKENKLVVHDGNITKAKLVNALSTPSATPTTVPQLPLTQQLDCESAEMEQVSDNVFTLPPVTMLRQPVRLKDQRFEKTINQNVKLLEQTLANFSVQAEVAAVCYGPTITRYEIYPAPGIKVSRIVSLADDIALNLAATAVRIEAPIPGKAAIGIEVPNRKTQPVLLREVIESKNFAQCTSPLGVALGKDISGTPIVADLVKMPHLLIAGATGSGKSVCINTIISSILFKATPDQVKLL